MNQDKNLPVDMIIVEPTAIEGVHVEQGTVFRKMDALLAMDLAGSGKARPATDELIKEFEDRKAAKKAADEAAAEAAKVAAANALGNTDVLASLIADAFSKGIATALAGQSGDAAAKGKGA